MQHEGEEKADLSEAIEKGNFNAVQAIIKRMPEINVVEDAKADAPLHRRLVYREKVDELYEGVSLAVKKATDGDNLNPEKWDIALFVFQECLRRFPYTIKCYFEEYKNHDLFAYDQTQILGFSDFSPLYHLFKTIFIDHKGGKFKKFVSELSPLIEILRSIGWGRTIKISDDPKQAIKDFREYLNNFSPEVANSLKIIPSEELSPALSELTIALKKGKAFDDKEHLKARRLFYESLDKPLQGIKPLIAIAGGYAGFFFRLDNKAEENLVVVPDHVSFKDYIRSGVVSFCGLFGLFGCKPKNKKDKQLQSDRGSSLKGGKL